MAEMAWADVTSTSPLKVVTRDGVERDAVALTSDSLTVGARVRCELPRRGPALVHGRADGVRDTGWVTSRVGKVNRVVFTSGGTYLKPANLLYADIEVQAAGGQGGGRQSGANQVAVAGGGGGGQYIRAILAAASISSSTTVTVGAGGTGGAGTTGGNGGNSSFGTLIVAVGGRGGDTSSNQPGTTSVSAAAGNGGSGGTVPSGALNIPGSNGSPGRFNYNAGLGANSLNGSMAGAGGASFLGTSVNPYMGASHAGFSGAGYGSGSTGGLGGPSLSASAAPDGQPGIVIITEYLSS